MQNGQSSSANWLNITQAEINELFRVNGNPEGLARAILLFVGLLLTPVTLLGALLFYRRAYNRFMFPNNEYPRLANLRPIVKLGMMAGAILIWFACYFTLKLMFLFISTIGGNTLRYQSGAIPTFFGFNIIITIALLIMFRKWQGSIFKYLSEVERYGTARFTTEEEILPYRRQKGFYIGNGLFYNKAGHLLTVAGTRGGKGVNIILPNLLQPHLFKGSWVIIDPKGENAAVSARIQREAGRKVVMLNPWDLLSLGNSRYNPLDILKSDRLNLSDDIQMIAEAIVPTQSGGDQDHFDNRARAFVSGLLLHLVTAAPAEDRHLGTLWQWFRLDNQKWIELLADMMLNDDEIAGEIVKACANEIDALMKNSDREYGSVISSAQKYTDFIKSPALREAMKVSDEFTSADLQAGNVTVYVIIPADRLKSHSQWLRLVVTSLIRSVIRNPQRDVCFLLDEFYALGYLSEIDAALGAYAGFGVHIWAILQNLGQLNELYGKNWENFISSCGVRHFFNVSDNFSVDYISQMFGQTSVPQYDDKGAIAGATARPLVLSDELRRKSGVIMYSIIDQLAPTMIYKRPYYTMGLDCDKNPYYKPGGESEIPIEDATAPNPITERPPKVELELDQ